MDVKAVLAQHGAAGVLDALHDGAMNAAIDALAGVLARAEARRLLPELKAERKRQAAELPRLHDAIEQAEVAIAERAALVREAQAALAELPDGVLVGLTHEQYASREHWRVALQRRSGDQHAGGNAANIARRRYSMAQDALAEVDAKIQALESLELDAETLRELGKALA